MRLLLAASAFKALHLAACFDCLRSCCIGRLKAASSAGTSSAFPPYTLGSTCVDCRLRRQGLPSSSLLHMLELLLHQLHLPPYAPALCSPQPSQATPAGQCFFYKVLSEPNPSNRGLALGSLLRVLALLHLALESSLFRRLQLCAPSEHLRQPCTRVIDSSILSASVALLGIRLADLGRAARMRLLLQKVLLCAGT